MRSNSRLLVPGELHFIVNFQLAPKFFGGGDKSHYRHGCTDSLRFAVVLSTQKGFL